MDCTNCGVELDTDAKYCSNCGTERQAAEHRRKEPVPADSPLAVTLGNSGAQLVNRLGRRSWILIGGLLLAVFLFGQAASFISDQRLESELGKIRDRISQGDLAAAESALSDGAKFDPSDPLVREVDQLLAVVRESASAFESAQSAEAAGDLVGALEWYGKVATEDKRNFERAQAASKRLLPTAIVSGVADVKELVARGKLGEALAKISALKLAAPENAEVASLAGEVRAKQEAQLAADAAAALKRGKTALASLRSKRDDFKQVTWLEDRSAPRYIDQDGFYAYIGKWDDGTATLRLKIQYEDDDWLFIESYQIKVDGYVYDIAPEYGDVERDNDSRIWEWYDTVVSSYERGMLDQIVKAKKVQIRFNGSQYYDTRTLSSSEKRAIENVLLAFDYLQQRVSNA